MAHQPLALKYRPATFSDVVAQEHVTRTVVNALDRGRIAQAYLFSGPRGTGKTTTARLLAKALNCETGISGEPCGTCANCLDIAAGRSLDVIEIDAASNRGIDDIKELRETVKYAAAQGRWKVYIVDEVHQLSKDAFNAFLKTLEEPPKNVVFVLATTEPHKILPTILSRCQRFDFRPIPLPAIRERIRSIAEAEGFQIDERAEHAIAKKADGGLRDALSLLDQVVAFGGDAIDVATLRRLIGMPDEERYLELTSLLAEGDAAKSMAFARELRAAGYDLEEFYTGFLEHLRDALLFAIGDGAGTSEVTERYHESYRSLASTLGPERLLRMLTVATDEERAFRRSSQQGLVLEVLLVRLAMLDRTVDLDRALEALGKGSAPAGAGTGGKAATGRTAGSTAARRSAGTDPAPARDLADGESADRAAASDAAAADEKRAASDPAGEPEGPLDLERLKGAWSSVVEAVHRIRPTVAAALVGARPVACSEERVTLALPAAAEFRIEQLRAKGTLDPLASVFEERWEWTGRIEVETAEREPDAPEPPAATGSEARDDSREPDREPDRETTPEPVPRPVTKRGPTAREAAERDVDARLEGDPLLRQVVELFDANVVRLWRPTSRS